MCLNKKCTRREKCYRSQAIPNLIQYCDEFKKIRDYDTCPFFIEIGEKKIRAEYRNGSEPIPEPKTQPK
jgi:hypothetical protein